MDNKIQITVYPQKFNVPKIDLLTEEEVALEKTQLPPIVNQSKKTYIIDEDDLTYTQVLSEEQVQEKQINENNFTLIQDQSNFSPILPPDMVIKHKDGQTETMASFKNSELTPYLSGDIKVEISSVENNAESTFMKANASVFSIEDNRIVVFDENKGYLFINKIGNFKVFINGKSMRLSNLSIGDKISIEGEIKEGSTFVKGTIVLLGYSSIFSQ